MNLLGFRSASIIPTISEGSSGCRLLPKNHVDACELQQFSEVHDFSGMPTVTEGALKSLIASECVEPKDPNSVRYLFQLPADVWGGVRKIIGSKEFKTISCRFLKFREVRKGRRACQNSYSAFKIITVSSVCPHDHKKNDFQAAGFLRI
eukprot:389731-Pyramimonas_sp.AAC.1